MSEYILKLQKHENTSAPYLQELGHYFFIFVCVPHPQRALKFSSLDSVIQFTESIPEKVRRKFVARPLLKEIRFIQEAKREARRLQAWKR